EQLEILEGVISRLKLRYYSGVRISPYDLNGIVYALGQIKKEGMTPEDIRKYTLAQFDIDREHPDMFYKRAYREFKAGDIKPQELRSLERTRDKNLELAGIYAHYQEVMAERELYDFDDVIIGFIKELKHPESE